MRLTFKQQLRTSLSRMLDWLGYRVPKPISPVVRKSGKGFLTALLGIAVPVRPVPGLVKWVAERTLELAGRTYRPANDFLVHRFSVPDQPQVVEFPKGRLYGYRLPWHKDFTIGFMLCGGIVEQEVSGAAESILRKGDAVFDIGANLGFTTLHFADLVGPQGKVFAFEPDPELANRLDKVRELNSLPQMFVRREAVSHEQGGAWFIIGEESYLGRLADISQVSNSNRLIPVNITSVDRVVADEEITRVSLIKIDVEGSELNVLHGMVETLGSHKPILLIEFHTSELEEHGISFMKDHGYRCELLDRAPPTLRRCHYLCRPL